MEAGIGIVKLGFGDNAIFYFIAYFADLMNLRNILTHLTFQIFLFSEFSCHIMR